MRFERPPSEAMAFNVKEAELYGINGALLLEALCRSMAIAQLDSEGRKSICEFNGRQYLRWSLQDANQAVRGLITASSIRTSLRKLVRTGGLLVTRGLGGSFNWSNWYSFPD